MEVWNKKAEVISLEEVEGSRIQISQSVPLPEDNFSQNKKDPLSWEEMALKGEVGILKIKGWLLLGLMAAVFEI